MKSKKIYDNPTADELRKRRQFLQKMRALSSQRPLASGPFPSAEQMVREDRER